MKIIANKKINLLIGSMVKIWMKGNLYGKKIRNKNAKFWKTVLIKEKLKNAPFNLKLTMCRIIVLAAIFHRATFLQLNQILIRISSSKKKVIWKSSNRENKLMLNNKNSRNKANLNKEVNLCRP